MEGKKEILILNSSFKVCMSITSLTNYPADESIYYAIQTLQVYYVVILLHLAG